MQPALLFSTLESISRKPPVFSVYTARELWTDDHTSAQMLAYHLNGDIDVSSRRTSFIERSVRWMNERFGLSQGRRVVDFGCGPGLYTSRFAELGADVVGVDFSARSIEYARACARANGLEIEYVEADYLEVQLEGSFDLVTLIMCDYCALSPAQRHSLLRKFAGLLSDRGRIVLDVYSLTAYAEKQVGLTCEKNQLHGFWSPDDYFGFVASFKYDDDKVSLDKYTVVEAHRQREIYNWLQYYTPESLGREVAAAGLEVEERLGDVAGGAYDHNATEFAVVLKQR